MSMLALISLASLACYISAITRIELTEGEIYFHNFNNLLFDKSTDMPFTFDVQEKFLTDVRKYDAIETEQILKTSLTRSSDANAFVDVRCSLDNTGNKNQVSLIYSRNDSSSASRFYIEVKEVTYKNQENIYKRALPVLREQLKLNLTQQSIISSTCTETVLINEFNRVLLVCMSSQNNQFYIIMLCSDNSCSEVSEALKITEYQRGKSIDNMRLKKMPGVTNTTFSFLIYFENTNNVEYMIFDNNGNIDSVVYTLSFDITKIRYFSGQLLVIEGKSNVKNLTTYTFFDFGIYKLNLDKIDLRQMSHFGQFVNSFVSGLTGEIVVELLDNDTLVDLSLDRNTYEFAVEFSKIIPESDKRPIVIFEIGGSYQLVGFASQSDTLNISKWMVVNKNKMMNASDEADEKQTINTSSWTKVQGFYQLSGCKIDKTDAANWTFELFDVHFNIPYLPLNASSYLVKPNTDNNGPFNISVKAKNGSVIDTVSIEIRPQANFRIDKKWLLNESITLQYDEISTHDEAMLDSVITGNFLAMQSMGLKSGEVLNFKNKVNPLLSYHTLEYTNESSPADYSKASGLVSISTLYNLSFSCQILFYTQTTNTISVYVGKGRSVVKEVTEQFNMGFSIFEPFNETVYVAHSDQGLFLYDSGSKRPQELVFDSGLCTKMLLLRHSKMDLTIWCIAKGSTSVYYARDLIEGRSGIRRLPLSMETDLSEYLLETSDHFPDFIYALDKIGNLFVLKVDANSNLLVQEIGKFPLSTSDKQYKSVAFKFQNQFMMIYQIKRIGYGYQIVLQFFFFKNPMMPVKTKTIELDFIFTPNLRNLAIFKIQHDMKYSINQKDRKIIHTMAIPVMVKGKHHNVIYIDPKAPMSSSLPFTLFTMDSEVDSMMAGISVHSSSNAYKFGMIVYYTYKGADDKNRSVLVKITDTTNILKVNPNTEGNIFFIRQSQGRNLRSLPVNITFDSDIYHHTNDLITIKIDHRKEGNLTTTRDSLFFTKPGEMKIQMEEVRKYGVLAEPDKVNATLYDLIDVVSLTTGNAFNWTIGVESYLESVSKTIQLNTLVRDREIIPVQQIPMGNKFNRLAANCSNPSRSYINLTLPKNINRRVGIDIHFCIDTNGVIVFSKIYDFLVTKPLYQTMINRLPTSSQEYVRIQNSGFLLEVISLRRPLGRKVFTDFYMVDYNLTNSTNQTMNLKYAGRKFFSESCSEYMVQTNKSYSSGEFDIYEWFINGMNSTAYSIALKYERWQFNEEMYNNNSTNPITKVYTISISNIIEADKLKMEVFENFQTTMIDINNPNSLLLMIEHSSLDSYILKFNRSIIDKGYKGTLNPIVWRIDNPLYSFDDNAYEIKSQKSDWLLLSLRIIGEECYLIVYITPDIIFETAPQLNNNSIFSKEVSTFTDVVDFKLESSSGVKSSHSLIRHEFRQSI